MKNVISSDGEDKLKMSLQSLYLKTIKRQYVY
jgi:hypothetical protein